MFVLFFTFKYKRYMVTRRFFVGLEVRLEGEDIIYKDILGQRDGKNRDFLFGENIELNTHVFSLLEIK